MKKYIYIIVPALILTFFACKSAGGPGGGKFAPAEFKAKMDSIQDEQLVDVRTPEEYAGGFIEGAQNIDWRGSSFADKASKLDKNKPVFVYCLSGGRSAEAVSWFSANGFKNVYELQGGIRNWTSSGMPLATGNTPAPVKQGVITTGAYKQSVSAQGVVLVDFGATWCGPCKILAPRLEELVAEMPGKFTLVKIDADRDAQLCDSMNITALPTLILYKNGEPQWRNEGLVPKELVAEKINAALK
ncbi:MAG: thioredoxin domain-containing protein [Bacteroidia bacterium]